MLCLLQGLVKILFFYYANSSKFELKRQIDKTELPVIHSLHKNLYVLNFFLNAGIETLLCYLELDSLMKVFLPTRSVCSIQCYDGPRQMALVAKKCPAVALGLASKGKFFLFRFVASLIL